MKRISRNIKYIATIILCFVVIGLNINFLHAIDGIDASETGNITESPIIDIDLNPIISSPVVDINTPVRVSFYNADVLSYSVETDGLIATEVTNGSMEYDIVATGEFGTMDVYATYSGNIVKKSSVYTYKANNKVYISDVSKDQAWYEWIEESIDESLEYLGEFTADIAQELYYELCGGYTEEYAPQYNELLSNDTVPGKTVVQGKLFWQEDSGTVPLIKVKVQLIKKVDGMTHVIDSQYSNPDGSFRFEINNSNWNDSGENIFIRWWLEAETFKVTNNWILNHYCFQSSLRKNVAEGTTQSFYYNIPRDEGLIHYRATYVHQAMTITERFAIAMGMPVPNYGSQNENKTKLNVSYPALLVPEDSGYCWGNNGQSIAAIGKLQFSDVDMITHEYGHYVQYLMGIYGANLLEIACNWPEHHPLDDHLSDNWEKEYAMELTWSEAWASTFSTLSEQYYWYRIEREYGYFDDNVGPNILPRVGAMSNNSCLGWNSETPNNSSYNHDGDSTTPALDNRGEFQEMSVEALLWDLYDDYSSIEPFDQISLDYRNWWFYTTRFGIYTLEDFTQYMDEHRPDLRDKMGRIMSNCKIAPEIVSVSDCSKNEPPTVTFVVNGSQEHPNNRFEVMFYDDNGNLLSQTDTIIVNVSHVSNYTYSISSSVWNSVLEELNYECDKTYKINIAIAGYRYDITVISNSIRSVSGPYLSAYIEKTIAIEHDFEYEEHNGTHHKLICHNCNGEETLIAHDFEYTSVDATYHTKICAYCGYSETKGHVFEYKNMGDYHILACKECGRTSGSPQNHSWSPANIGNIGIIIDDCVKCQFCGCLKILGPGEFIPVIKGIKPEIEEETE